MRTEDLYEAIHAQPFQGFSVILPSGERVHVHHPEFAAMPSGRRHVAIFPRESTKGVKVLDVALLGGIEFNDPLPAGQVREDEPEVPQGGSGA